MPQSSGETQELRWSIHICDEETKGRSTGKPFIKLPNVALGKLLDHGRASAYAIKLLAIKLSHGGGYALNEISADRHYDLGRRGFRQGIRLLTSNGVLHRMRHGRRLATDEVVETGEHYTPLPECLLTRPADLVAFVAAVRLSPQPQRAHDVAARIGVKSRGQVRALVRAAADHIASSEGPRGVTLVARHAHIYDLAKNVPVNDVLVNDVPIHSRWKQGTRTESKATEIGRDGGRSSLREDHTPPNPPEGGVHAKVFSDRAEAADDPAWITLSDWKSAPYFQKRGVWAGLKRHPGTPSLARWLELTLRFGGAPAHVLRPSAYEQVVEIAHELTGTSHRRCADLTVRAAVEGVAFALCRAHKSGRKIRSLGFIAQDLVCRTLRDDLAWAFDLPSTVDLAPAHAFATALIGELETAGWSVSRRSLLSTLRLEELADVLSRHDARTVRNAFWGERAPAAGETVIAWGYWDAQVERLDKKAAARAKRRAVEQRVAEVAERQRAELRAEEERLKPICEIRDRLLATAERCGHRLERWHPFRARLPVGLEVALKKVGKGDLAKGIEMLERAIEVRQPSSRRISSIDFFLKDRSKAKSQTEHHGTECSRR